MWRKSELIVHKIVTRLQTRRNATEMYEENCKLVRSFLVWLVHYFLKGIFKNNWFKKKTSSSSSSRSKEMCAFLPGIHARISPSGGVSNFEKEKASHRWPRYLNPAIRQAQENKTTIERERGEKRGRVERHKWMAKLLYRIIKRCRPIETFLQQAYERETKEQRNLTDDDTQKKGGGGEFKWTMTLARAFWIGFEMRKGGGRLLSSTLSPAIPCGAQSSPHGGHWKQNFASHIPRASHFYFGNSIKIKLKKKKNERAPRAHHVVKWDGIGFQSAWFIMNDDGGSKDFSARLQQLDWSMVSLG